MEREMEMRRIKTSSMRLRWLFKESSFTPASPKEKHPSITKRRARSGVLELSIDCLAKDIAFFPGNARVRSPIKRICADCQQKCVSHQYHITV